MAELGWEDQQELATAAGINQGTVSKYLSGNREPKATAVLSLAIALGVPVDHLLGTEVIRKRHHRSVTPIPDSDLRPSRRAAKL